MATQNHSQFRNKENYKLSHSTIEKLKYYVYTLSDPQTNKVFYVGKGKGNRINHHLLGALEQKTKETEKIKRIREIQKTGLEVGLDIVRHGLTEKEAFEVESTIIDLIGMSNLTNLQSGHHSHLRGKMTLQDIETEYQAKPAKFDEPVMLIRINRLYSHEMSAKDLYEATRKHWRVKSGEKPKIVCAVYAGIIREVYSVKKWSPSSEIPGRHLFSGDIAKDDIRHKYINKSVANIFKQGDQNAIRYVGE